MKRRLLAAALAVAAASFAQTPALRPGPVPGGGYLLPSGWISQPAGRQIPLGAFPMRAAVSPNGRFLAVLEAGAQPSVRLLETAALRETGRVPLEDAWFGLAFSPGGDRLYAGGGAAAVVHELAVSRDGKLERKRGLSIVPRGEQRAPEDFAGDVALTPDGRLIYVANLFRNQIAVINPQSGWVIERFPAARRPYRLLFHPDGKSLFATSWAEGSLHHLEAANGSQLSMVRLGPQPMDIAWSGRAAAVEEDEQPPGWRARLFVATANMNQVHVLALNPGGGLDALEPIRLSLWPFQPLGMTPSALAVSPDGARLYAVCSDANVVAAVDISREKSRVLGYFPAGWYPTAVQPLDDGRVFVLNGKGGGSPAAAGAAPGERAGSASVFEPADGAELFRLTKTVLRLSPYNDRLLVMLPIPDGNPVPPGARVPPELASPIRHVLYIVKGGFAYDEILGEFGRSGGGPPAGAPGAAAVPNHQQLAREFVLFDNFHLSGDSPAGGLFWSTAAIAPAFVERLGPAADAGRLKHAGFDARELAALPPAGYLWSNAISAGLSVRNYGFEVENADRPGEGGDQVRSVHDRSLWNVTNRKFRGPDPGYPDAGRAKAFLADLASWESEGEMPRLMVMRLANGGGGTSPDAAADNDYALGLIVEACSKSRFWPRMAVFVAESRAGGRRVPSGSHRAPAFVASPYARRGAVDSTFYNSASLLRTIELILGLMPMTQFDAAAAPMWEAFQNQPRPAAFTALKPRGLPGGNP